MTTQKSGDRKPRPSKSAVPPNGLFGVSRAGRVKSAGAPKQKPQADLINPDAHPQNPAQDLPIQVLENSSQATAPRPGGIAPPPRNSPRRGWPLSRREPCPRKPPAPVPVSGRLPSGAASRGFSRPPRRPSGWQQSPPASRSPRWRERRPRKEGSPIVVPLDTRARSPSCGAEREHVRGLFRNGSPSNRETVPPLAPAAREHRAPGLRSHPDAKTMRPAAPASIRLERSFHLVMTPGSERCGPTSSDARPALKSRRSEINHATLPTSLCQLDALPRRPHPLENFFLSPPTPYARLRPSSGRHQTKRFPSRWGPSHRGFSTFVDISVEIVSRPGALLLGVVVVDLCKLLWCLSLRP